jgi:hypothetical protein
MTYFDGETVMRKLLISLSLFATAGFGAMADVPGWPRPAECVASLTVLHGDCDLRTYFVCPSPEGKLIRRERQAYAGTLEALITTTDYEFVTLGGDKDPGALKLYVPSKDRLNLSAALEGQPQEYVEYLKYVRPGSPVLRLSVRKRVERVDETAEVSGRVFQKVLVTSVLDGSTTEQIALYLNDEIGFPIEGEYGPDHARAIPVESSQPIALFFDGETGFAEVGQKAGCVPWNG